MKIALHTFSWNESRLVDYFFRHYGQFIDKFYFYDNGSTDNTIDKISSYKNQYKIEIIQKTTDEFIKFFEKEWSIIEKLDKRHKNPLYLFGVLVRNFGWKYFRDSDEDWVINCDFDEFIWNKDIKKYLSGLGNTTIVKTIGYQMIIDPFPLYDGQLCDICTFGWRFKNYDKPSIFNPKKIQDINIMRPGNHDAYPIGEVKWDTSGSVINLHFRNLGLQYLIDRYKELSFGGLASNPRVAKQYRASKEKLKSQFKKEFQVSKQLPFLKFSNENLQSYNDWMKRI